MSIYGNAFSYGVWAALSSLLIAGTLALYFVLRRENTLPHNASYAAKARLQKLKNAGIKADQQQVIELQERWDLSEILLVVVGAVCQQGCARDPSTSASRILYLSLLLMATVVLTAFSAVLTAGVSTQTPTCLTAEKLGKKSLISIFDDLVSRSIDSASNKVNPSCVDSANVSRTGKGNQPFPWNVTCPAGVQSMNISFKRLMQVRILEVGIIRRKHQDPLKSTGQQQCRQTGANQDEPSESQFLSISISDVWPAIAQLLTGLCTALILLAIEIRASS